MIAKAWIALALGAAFMVGGVATVSAASGNLNGDCIMDKLQLKDGSCEDCPNDLTLSDGAPDDSVEDCDSCNDYLYDWNYLYGETELEPPFQSASGQE
jgi:hypothetical protein